MRWFYICYKIDTQPESLNQTLATLRIDIPSFSYSLHSLYPAKSLKLDFPETDGLRADAQNTGNLSCGDFEMQKDGKQNNPSKRHVAAGKKGPRQGCEKLPASAATDSLAFPESRQRFFVQDDMASGATMLSIPMDPRQYPATAGRFIQKISLKILGHIAGDENAGPVWLIIFCFNFHGFHFSTPIFFHE
jgi:hypothetical protein